MPEEMTYAILALIVTVVVFFIGREFFCWYFKINEIVNVLKDIRDKRKVDVIKGDDTLKI